MSNATAKTFRQVNAHTANIKSALMQDNAQTAAAKVTDKFTPTDDISYGNLQELYNDLLERYRKLTEEKDAIDADARMRQDSYLRKEQKYREQLGTLSERMTSLNLDDDADQRMHQIRDMHHTIQDTIGEIQGKTSKILQDQERDLIRAFRARLADVTAELDQERKKNESGSVEWVARCRKLTEELEWLRDLTDKLTAENKNVLMENRRFKRQLKTQEEDREFLIKQLVSVKKENARLRYSFEQAGLMGGLLTTGPGGNNGPIMATKGGMAMIEAGNKKMVSNNRMSKSVSSLSKSTRRGAGSRPQSASRDKRSLFGSSNNKPLTQTDRERYDRLLRKTQRQLEAEQVKLRNMRTAYSNEIASRTELQTFLKKCIEDVRADIAERTRKQQLRQARRGGKLGRTRPKTPIDPRTIPLEDFTPADRINVMEWLLSQDHVIYMLYEKMFPRNTSTQGSNLDAAIDYREPDENTNTYNQGGHPGYHDDHKAHGLPHL